MKNTKDLEKVLKDFGLNNVIIEEIEETGKGTLGEEANINISAFMEAVNKNTKWEAKWNSEHDEIIIEYYG